MTRDAIRTRFDRYGDMVFRRARHILGTDAAAEEGRVSGDICAENSSCGDEICDEDCANPDPDCAGAETTETAR